MSPTRQYIYIFIFSVILLISFFAIFKLIKQNKTNPQYPSQPIADPLDTQIVNWNQAEQLMADCKVKSIFQKHDLTVTLRTHNNQIFQTTETKIDDIFNLAKKYQSPCDIIQMISE